MPSKAEVLKEFQTRHQAVVEQSEADRLARRAEKEQMQAANPGASRGADKQIDKFESTFQSSTQFFTTASPDLIEG